MDGALARLRSRVDEVARISRDLADPADPRIANAERNIASTIRDVFGVDSVEFGEHEHYEIMRGPFRVGMPRSQFLEARRQGLSDARALLESLIALVEEVRVTPGRGGDLSAMGPVDTSFVRDPSLLALIHRDLAELGHAVRANLHKSALLLCGSILEAALLDVLNRNASVAKTFLGNKQSAWPDGVSLSQLIQIAGSVRPVGGGVAGPLLTPTAASAATSVTDHRDLVHPRAELRSNIRVDAETVALMIALLKSVFRDLKAASQGGLIDAYERGDLAT